MQRRSPRAAAGGSCTPQRAGFGDPGTGNSTTLGTNTGTHSGKRSDHPRLYDIRSSTLNKHKVSISLLAVVMLVILRVTIGWHFLYEGVWKITNPFSAEPFLTQAKGPLAQVFYAMVPDIDGRQRLQIGTDAKGQEVIRGDSYIDAWQAMKDRVVGQYGLNADQTARANELLARYKKAAEEYLAENLDDIKVHFRKLALFESRKAAEANGPAHQKQRIWEEQQKLRAEVNVWLDELDTMGEDFRLALWDLLDDQQKQKGPILGPVCTTESLPVNLPLVSTRTELLNFAVTYGLTAIGLCLMAGFFTRLAALGGAAFLTFVVLSQFPWPTVYPHAPEVVGHALMVDKNFVELVALLALAALPVGRWAGLDWFLYEWICRPLRRCCGCGHPAGDPEAGAGSEEVEDDALEFE